MGGGLGRRQLPFSYLSIDLGTSWSELDTSTSALLVVL